MLITHPHDRSPPKPRRKFWRRLWNRLAALLLGVTVTVIVMPDFTIIITVQISF